MIPTKIDQQMDPRLQYAIARSYFGITEFATASTEENEIAVIARVSNVAAWENMSEVSVGATLGKQENGDTIVTGRVPVVRIQVVRGKSFVKSLKATQRLSPVLASSTDETNARPQQLPTGNLTNGGAGVVIGIIDYGCDFAHENFLTLSGQSRFRSIWHQAGTAQASSPFGYGREFKNAEINAALTQSNPYAALGYGPSMDPSGTHGTHVMDIATGNGRGTGVPGLAPQSDIVFVDISHADIPFDGPAVVGSTFGDSARLLEAIQYIFDQANGQPCVVNISLGTNGGPHDGSTLVEEGIDRIVRAGTNRAVVIAASNSFTDGIHASETVTAGGTTDLIWEIPPGDISHNEFELWYDGNDRIAVELIKPNGENLGILEPGQNGTITNNGQIEVFAANRLGDPNNNDNLINIFLDESADAGSWTIRLTGRSITNGAFHAWIERDNLRPSQFSPPHDNSHTIGSISCGRESIVVGSYDAHKSSRPISFFSSSGPTRDQRSKPEISAPGHRVLAARSRTNNGVVRKSGTSMAAPAVCGIVGLMFAEAAQRNLSLSVGDVRSILQSTARSSPPTGTGWDARYGEGRIDANAAVSAVIQKANAGTAATKVARSKRKSASRKARKSSAAKKTSRKTRRKQT
ncbi:MAG: S8 family serine peptidase [Hyphomicrobiaceae bacterium]